MMTDNKNNVLLQRAVSCNNTKERLFDIGHWTQGTYITTELRNKLNVRTIRKEATITQFFGKKSSEVQDVDIGTFEGLSC